LFALSLAAAYVLSTTRLREFFAASPAYSVALFAAFSLIMLPAGPIAATLLAATAAWFSLRRNWPSVKADTSSHILRPGQLSRHPLANS
jgi:hypothetical protein